MFLFLFLLCFAIVFKTRVNITLDCITFYTQSNITKYNDNEEILRKVQDSALKPRLGVLRGLDVSAFILLWSFFEPACDTSFRKIVGWDSHNNMITGKTEKNGDTPEIKVNVRVEKAESKTSSKKPAAKKKVESGK